jgi:hypothetical protein
MIRSRDRYCIETRHVEERAKVVIPFGAISSGHLGGTIGIEVGDGDKPCTFEFSELAGVTAAENSGSYDAHV